MKKFVSALALSLFAVGAVQAADAGERVEKAGEAISQSGKAMESSAKSKKADNVIERKVYDHKARYHKKRARANAKKAVE